jgi:hypothetical protein
MIDIYLLLSVSLFLSLHFSCECYLSIWVSAS